MALLFSAGPVGAALFGGWRGCKSGDNTFRSRAVFIRDSATILRITVPWFIKGAAGEGVAPCPPHPRMDEQHVKLQVVALLQSKVRLVVC